MAMLKSSVRLMHVSHQLIEWTHACRNPANFAAGIASPELQPAPAYIAAFRAARTHGEAMNGMNNFLLQALLQKQVQTQRRPASAVADMSQIQSAQQLQAGPNPMQPLGNAIQSIASPLTATPLSAAPLPLMPQPVGQPDNMQDMFQKFMQFMQGPATNVPAVPLADQNVSIGSTGLPSSGSTVILPVASQPVLSTLAPQIIPANIPAASTPSALALQIIPANIPAATAPQIPMPPSNVATVPVLGTTPLPETTPSAVVTFEAAVQQSNAQIAPTPVVMGNSRKQTVSKRKRSTDAPANEVAGGKKGVPCADCGAVIRKNAGFTFQGYDGVYCEQCAA